jgi:hypothetical protein
MQAYNKTDLYNKYVKEQADGALHSGCMQKKLIIKFWQPTQSNFIHPIILSG